jgi:hypothetical protein
MSFMAAYPNTFLFLHVGRSSIVMHFLTCVNDASQDKTASTAADFLHFAFRGTARLSFTACIEGVHSDRAASASKKDGLAAPRCAYPLELSSSFFKGVAKVALNCAHRTSTFLSCAFCEQRGHLAAPSPLLRRY